MKRFAALVVALVACAALARTLRAEDDGATTTDARDTGDAGAEEVAEVPWCAPELEALGPDVCHFSRDPAEGTKRTLVIFLHGVIQQGTTWQHTQQRAIVRAANVHRLTMLAPRGRVGIGPKGMKDWITWPTGRRAQIDLEDELVGEWLEAERALVERFGEPFRERYVFGFSNGAYYATSLSMRGRLDLDGYAVFAGGAASKGLAKSGPYTKKLVPMYVGYGLEDKAHRDPAGLGRALEAIGWPVKVGARRGVGHTMTDSMVKDALAFFRSRLSGHFPRRK